MGYPVGYCATVLLLLCEYCYVCENLTVISRMCYRRSERGEVGAAEVRYTSAS